MSYSIVSRTFSGVVGVQEASKHLRLWDNSEDDYVQALIEAGTEVAEKYMNRLIAESTVIIERSTLTLALPLGKAKSVSSVTYVNDITEERVELLPAAYTFNQITNKIELKRSVQQALDSVGARNFQITFVTGWSEEDVPSAIKQGILMLVASMYEMREDAAVGQGITVTEVPITHRYLFNKFKIHTI